MFIGSLLWGILPLVCEVDFIFYGCWCDRVYFNIYIVDVYGWVVGIGEVFW